MGIRIGFAGSGSSRIVGAHSGWKGVAHEIGILIGELGHTLISGGCAGGFTEECAKGVMEARKFSGKEHKSKIISLIYEDYEKEHITFGSLLECKGLNANERRELLATQIDVMITLGGRNGTQSEFKACRSINVPVIPIGIKSYASGEQWNTLSKRVRHYYEGAITVRQFKLLSDITNKTILKDKKGLAKTVIDLAEKIVKINKNKIDANKDGDVLILHLLDAIEKEQKSYPWSETMIKVLNSFQKYVREPDVIQNIKYPIFEMANKFKIGGESIKLLKMSISSEPLNNAANIFTWGHLRHSLHVFFLGYFLINSGFLNISHLAVSLTRGQVINEKRHAHIVNIAWFIASIFHDIGLLGERITNIENKCNKLLKVYPVKNFQIKCTPDKKQIWGEMRKYIDKLTEYMSENTKKNFKEYISKVSEISIDHGVLSAVTLLSSFDENEDEEIVIAYKAAAQAVALHNIANSSEYLNGIDFKHNPLSSLLILCDQLQCWDRETGHGSRFKKLPIEYAKLSDLTVNLKKKSIYGSIDYYPYQGLILTDERKREMENELSEILIGSIFPILSKSITGLLKNINIGFKFSVDGIGKITSWPQ